MLLKTLSQASTNGTWWCPVRGMYVIDDVLYVTWGNLISSISESGVSTALRASGNIPSPTVAYDVSSVTADGELNSLKLDSSSAYNAASHSPFVAGAISYADEKTGTVYVSTVENKSESRRQYMAFDSDEMKAAITAGTTESLTVKRFTVESALSMNTSKFIVKDGWLYEILQQNGGLVDVTASNSLIDSDGNAMNNTVYVYDLNGIELTSSTQSVASCLRGVYTTKTAGNAVINDIEVIGDYMYLATTEGVEVVDLTAAKADGVTSDTAANLTSDVTLTDAGAVNDLESDGTILYAAFGGAEKYVSADESTDGNVIAYNTAYTPGNPAVITSQAIACGVADLSVNESEKRIYTLKDVANSPEMAAYSYITPKLLFESDSNVTYDIAPGVYDIKVELSNPDSYGNTVICVLYEGNMISDVVVTLGMQEGTITIAEDYEIGDEITCIKVMSWMDFNALMPLCEAVKLNK